MEPLTVRVRATCNVLGMSAGLVYDIEPSDRAERLLLSGHLELLEDFSGQAPLQVD